jgi:hypothetical protein
MVQTEKPREYRNSASTERVAVSKVSAPFRVAKNGTFIYARHDGKKWVW